MNGKFDHTILLLQGGGALGAYQAGAYEGLVEAGIVPDWVVGISIGGMNAALIAGNPPGRRVERLRAFWERVSAHVPLIPPPWLDPIRPALNQLSASASIINGVPGFFIPRVPPPSFSIPDEVPERLSYYDTEMLTATLEELADFDLINRHKVRLSLGTVNVSTGKSVYFDNHETQITPDHVRASGALPPGLPPVGIDGEYYWDGGVVSNSPLWYVLEHLPREKALVLQVDIFKADGDLPKDIDEVLRRDLDIRYASRVPFSSDRIRKLAEMHLALKRLLGKLPASLKNDPDVKALLPVRDIGEMTIARLTNRGLSHAGYSKDYEFSRATVEELWATGLEDVRHSIRSISTMKPTTYGSVATIYDLPPEPSSSKPKSHEEPELEKGVEPPARRSHNGESQRHLGNGTSAHRSHSVSAARHSRHRTKTRHSRTERSRSRR
ncbi:patatin-like phospholipase family protein [Pedosphaera parvula]|nr:patatin-like phospholipase family protein [Pedosphaera parvula]